MSNFTYSDALYHSGTKGMKWGVRRYQNEDGSLTEEARTTDQRKSRAAQLKKTADRYALKSAKVKRAATRRIFPMDPERAMRKIAKYDLKSARYENRSSDIYAKMRSEQSRAERLETKADKIISRLEKEYGSYTLDQLDQLNFEDRKSK